MPDVHIITGESIPKRLYGSDGGYALRPTSREELLSLEDRLFLQDQETKIDYEICFHISNKFKILTSFRRKTH